MKTKQEIEDNLREIEANPTLSITDIYMQGYVSALKWVLKD